MNMRILYVEDEKYLAEAVIHLLKKADIAVDYASDGEKGLELALDGEYDCLVLDIMLPKMTGWEILQAVRQREIATPILMLSALAGVDEKVRALDAGADDYLAKPFKTSELIARLKALTRRPALRAGRVLEFANLKYDLEKRTLNNIELTDKEAQILELFLKQPGQVIAKERLLAYGWGNEADATEQYVEVYISRLRQKFKQVKARAKIAVLRNLGYKLEAEETDVSETA